MCFETPRLLFLPWASSPSFALGSLLPLLLNYSFSKLSISLAASRQLSFLLGPSLVPQHLLHPDIITHATSLQWWGQSLGDAREQDKEGRRQIFPE